MGNSTANYTWYAMSTLSSEYSGVCRILCCSKMFFGYADVLRVGYCLPSTVLFSEHSSVNKTYQYDISNK